MRTIALFALALLTLLVAVSADTADGPVASIPNDLPQEFISEYDFLGGSEDTFELIVSLEWVGRSTEVADSCPYGSTMGSKVAEGLALLLDPGQVIFDNGQYTPPQNRNAVPPGNEWASWPHWHPYTWEVRHLRATFELPSVPKTIHDLFLFSPYYTAYGDILPINDNLYVYLNGTYVGVKGTYYEAKNGGMGGTAPFANETDGWYDDTGFGPIDPMMLSVGENVLDFVTEERVAWGAIGRLDLKLLVGVSGCEPVEPWLPRTQGYWRRQCKDHSHEDICAYVDSVHTLADLFDSFDCDSICDLMNVHPPENDMCRKARRQFMALLLNVASGKLAVCNCLEDGSEVGDVIAEIDSLHTDDPDFHACKHAKTLADDINNGIGIVPCDTVWIQAPPKTVQPPSISVTPNPFSKSTVIEYDVRTPGRVRLEIYDKTGRLVKTLVDSGRRRRTHKIEWDGMDDAGRRVPMGIYFSRLRVHDSADTKKMILVR